MAHKQFFVLLALVITVSCTFAQTIAPIPDGDNLLVWIRPEDDTAGQVALLSTDATVTVLPTAASVTDVSLCGDQPRSQDGRFVALSVKDAGNITLYQMNGVNPQLATLATPINPMTCVANGLQYAPNGNRVGYLTQASPAENEITLDGRLLIQDTTTLGIVGNFEKVAAFDMTDNGAAYVNFFQNTEGDFVEAAINVWDGTSTREIVSQFTDQDNGCAYLSASIAQFNQDILYVTLGIKCSRGETGNQYQMYRVETNNRTASLLLSGLTSGQYFAYTRTNILYPSPNGAGVFQTLPDNFDNNSARLIVTTLDTPAENAVLPQFIQMPQVTGVTSNNTPVLSPNGQWLAVVQNDPNDNATLQIVDLNAPAVPPILAQAGSRGDTITNVAFLPDSNRLFYVVGNAENNASYTVDLTTGISSRVGRGRFQPNSGVLSPYTGRVALTDVRTIADDQPAYGVIVLQDLGNAAQSDLLLGADIVDNAVTNVRQLVPLVWRR